MDENQKRRDMTGVVHRKFYLKRPFLYKKKKNSDFLGEDMLEKRGLKF